MDNGNKPKVTPWNILVSVFRAWFGVQTEENRQRDFNTESATPFIIAGIIFTLAMILGVALIVKLALP